MDERGTNGVDMRGIGEFIVKKLRKPRKEDVVAEFLGEIEKYRGILEEACGRLLGKDRAAKLMEMERQLLSRDSYLFEMSDIGEYGRLGFSHEENLLFYVAIDSEEVNAIKTDSAGRIEGSSTRLKTSPFFFLNPEIMKNRAKELEGTSFPAFLTPWIHEYSHFMGYCLQERPLAVAILLLFNHLAKDLRREDLINRDLIELVKSEKDGENEITRTIIYLQGLDEDMANYLEELILGEMGFDMSVYPKRTRGTWFYPHFKKWGKKRFVEYIENWNETNLVAPEFMKAFLKRVVNGTVLFYSLGRVLW